MHAATKDLRAATPLRLSIYVSLTLLIVSLNLVATAVWPEANIDKVVDYSSRAQRLARENLLPRPNMYDGLELVDHVVAQAALPTSLDVFPRFFMPISSAEPGRVFPSDGRARRTFEGLICPGEPRVTINKNVGFHRSD